jgi:hypothetical protein
MSEVIAREQIRQSWRDVEPSLVLKKAATLSGIGKRELRRLIEGGEIFASQSRPNTKGSTLRISKASLVDYLCETIR